MAYPVQEYVALVDSSGNLVGLPGTMPQGRLTLTTAVPVLAATVAGATAVLYTPYVGNFVPIYDGTVMMPTEFAELTNTLASATGGPAAAAVSENYDMFVWSNGGTLTLTRGPVWTNATTRSAGTALVRVKGLLLNNAAITNGPAASRGTYVGTVRTNAGAATVSVVIPAATDTAGFVGLDNAYNRVGIALASHDGNNWNVTSATVAQANGSANNQHSFVRGLNEEAIDATYMQNMATTGVVNSYGRIGVGLDSITAYAANSTVALLLVAVALGAVRNTQQSNWNGLPGLGFHYVAALQESDGTNAVGFTGNTQMGLTYKGRY